MPPSDLRLKLLAVAIAVALFLVVRGERRVTTSFAVPVEARIPAGVAAASTLPEHLTVSVSGPWVRLRALDAAEIGPVAVEVSRTSPGLATWFVRSESLHLPSGVRVESLHPAQGTVELQRERPVEAAAPHDRGTP